MTLRENVQRGADWLDTVRPGWERDIDPASLDLGSLDHCVLGQIGEAIALEKGVPLLFYGYNGVLYGRDTCLANLHAAVKGDPINWAVDRGFSAYGCDTSYRVLDDLWIAEIKDRVNR